MVFNWFRRQFSDRPEEPQIEETQTAQDQSKEKTPESEPAQAEQSEVGVDYLSWAKAAYQNIQQQQQTSGETEQVAIESAEGAESLAEPPTPEVAKADTLTQPSESIEPEATATAEFQTSEPEIVPVIELQTQETAATVESQVPEGETKPILEPGNQNTVESAVALDTQLPADVTSVEDEVAQLDVVDDSQTAESTVPFWAREDRQERLEKLKATAIEEPEPAVANFQTAQSAATQGSVEQAPELTFDEGFLWSAEVLASQGRRPDQISIEEISWLKRLRQGLEKTRRSLINQLKAIVGQGPLNQDAVMEIEALLLQADVGVEATDQIVKRLQEKLRQEVVPPEQAIAYLKEILRDMLDRPFKSTYSPTFAPEKGTLNIWLMTGVNGAGKTTTIGKIAHLAQKSDYKCLIGAADTFRAAAVEQVKIWGKRSGTEVIANTAKNTDPAAVVFDAIAAAQARGTEILLIDTAGRLQNKKNLMDELSKIRRIVDKKAPDARVESLLVLDATLGQNGLRQAQVFSEAAKLSGVILTKLDGTAKGGVALAVVQQLGLPIRFIGAGEGIEDLRPFSSYEFVEALLSG